MSQVSTQSEEVVFDLLHETAYPHSGLGRTILGPEENIKSISHAQLQDYIKTHYTGPRIVVSAAGAVDHGALVNLAKAAFGGLPSTNAAIGLGPAPFVGSLIQHRDDDLGLAHVAVGFETGGWTNPHAFPLMIMQTLLGNWDRTMGAGPNASSALCRKIGEGSYAHSLSTFNTTYKDTGLFGVYTVSEPTKVWELYSEGGLGVVREGVEFPCARFVVLHSCAVMYECVRLVHGTTEEEVSRAKTQLKTALLGGLDGTTAICEDIGRQVGLCL